MCALLLLPSSILPVYQKEKKKVNLKVSKKLVTLNRVKDQRELEAKPIFIQCYQSSYVSIIRYKLWWSTQIQARLQKLEVILF